MRDFRSQEQKRIEQGRTWKIWVTDEERLMISEFRKARDCSRKKRFETETDALRVAIRATTDSRNKYAVRPYACEWCNGGWHLTCNDFEIGEKRKS